MGRHPAEHFVGLEGLHHVIVGPDGQASDVPVQLASTRTGETREVLSGLKPDDVILAAGQ